MCSGFIFYKKKTYKIVGLRYRVINIVSNTVLRKSGD